MMKFCDSCGRSLEDTASFCDGCGASVQPSDPDAQSSSGPPDNLFQPPAEPSSNEPVFDFAPPPKRGVPKLVILLVVAIIGALVAGIALLSSGGGGNNSQSDLLEGFTPEEREVAQVAVDFVNALTRLDVKTILALWDPEDLEEISSIPPTVFKELLLEDFGVDGKMPRLDRVTEVEFYPDEMVGENFADVEIYFEEIDDEPFYVEMVKYDGVWYVWYFY